MLDIEILENLINEAVRAKEYIESYSENMGQYYYDKKERQLRDFEEVLNEVIDDRVKTILRDLDLYKS